MIEEAELFELVEDYDQHRAFHTHKQMAIKNDPLKNFEVNEELKKYLGAPLDRIPDDNVNIEDYI